MGEALARRGVRLGLLLVAAGAMFFACKGLLAKALYARGVEGDTLTAIRALIALPFFWAFGCWRVGIQAILNPPRRALWAAIVAGLTCYYLGALLNFRALAIIDASLERTLLFGYPAFVVLLTGVIEKKRPAAPVIVAVALTWFGVFLAAGGFDRGELRANGLGVLLTVLSGLSYAIYFLIAARYTHDLGSARFTLYAMTASAAALTLHVLVNRGFAAARNYDGTSWLLLLCIGTLAMAVPALLQAEGLRRAGAVAGSVVSTVGPPTTVILAWWLLDERLTPMQFAGVALIVTCVLALELRRSRDGPRPANAS